MGTAARVDSSGDGNVGSGMNIQEAAAGLRARKFSSREMVDESLRRIATANPKINAFITVTEESARARAALADDELGKGIDRGPLHGLPIAHKDLMMTRGVRTTAGSKIFADFVPEIDADVVKKLDDAGAVMVGKTNLHELAYGITSNNPHYGPVRNPWDVERITGGSSGGSGAALAADLVFMATGTDTGGSIRIPSSFCGTVGLKPTYGRVSTKGVIPLGITLDHIGPMTRYVRDAAISFQRDVGRAERIRAAGARRHQRSADRAAGEFLFRSFGLGRCRSGAKCGANACSVGCTNCRRSCARYRCVEHGGSHRIVGGSGRESAAASAPPSRLRSRRFSTARSRQIAVGERIMSMHNGCGRFWLGSFRNCGRASIAC